MRTILKSLLVYLTLYSTLKSMEIDHQTDNNIYCDETFIRIHNEKSAQLTLKLISEKFAFLATINEAEQQLKKTKKFVKLCQSMLNPIGNFLYQPEFTKTLKLINEMKNKARAILRINYESTNQLAEYEKPDVPFTERDKSGVEDLMRLHKSASSSTQEKGKEKTSKKRKRDSVSATIFISMLSSFATKNHTTHATSFMNIDHETIL